ncbi:hypothetical protein N7509_006457 [Penicillium cosmopolitanum]|uniref:Nephrocystin 3-like N-terminal domain-containing protein n=1 Tax=Penicillium cosmopolitanum TaxID=1131564 RepID=A0A9X0BB38_9EURO|nr:uncharacterized protein N7509_006457 [Penicillium cosmopolitanum]KAJ5398344.1 hypothetical protein N7509_006457 [Penicillium cosmopolitanum]
MSSERRERILDSLRFEQIYARKSGIKAAHAKTCRWLLSNAKYKEWLDPASLMQHRGFLWINGKPGAGKSTLMKFAYLNLKRQIHYKNAVIASFFFHARGHNLEKSISGMYRSLLLQLLEGYPELQSVLDDPEYFSQHETSCPSLNILKELFYSAVLSLGGRSFTCFIDALDECDEQQVVEMVQCFEDLAEQATANEISFRVCFSSRHYPHIIIRHGMRFILEEQPGHAEDLSAYAASRLVVRDPALTKELQCIILDKAAGVFMWVVLVVQILNEEERHGGMFLRKRLAEIPSSLSELFKDILGRNSGNTEALLLCLIWILYAERPLEPNEFYHAIWSGLSLKGLVDDQIPDVTPDTTDNLDNFRRYVISASKGLAETTNTKKPTVQFIHESVRDFLVKDKGLHELWPEIGYDCASPSHETLKQCCSVYLNHVSVRQRLCELPLEYDSTVQLEMSEQHPLMKYATQFILYHANLAAKVYPQDDFLSGFPMSDWIHLNNMYQQFKIRRYSPSATQFYIFAERGLSRLIRTIPRGDPQSFMKPEKYKYPFFAALASGSNDTVAAVLGLPSAVHKGIDILQGIDLKNDFKHDGRTPLSWAARNGHKNIFELLLREEDVDQREKTGQTPLMRASEGGHEALARILIEKGADIHASDQFGLTALHWAARKGNEEVARILIQKGAKLQARDQDGLTPLYWTLRKGREPVASLLIEEGADVHFRNEDGKTPLHWASKYGRETVARILIEKGADIQAIDQDGRTSLHWAAQSDCGALVKLLSQNGADIHSADNDGQTPLHLASQHGCEAAVKVLVWKEADADTSDENGKTPLHLASANSHAAVAALLILSGANINAVDQEGKTSLHLALESCCQRVAMILISRGANVLIGDKEGQTPLHCVSNRSWTSMDGHEAVVKLLIEKAADIDPRG